MLAPFNLKQWINDNRDLLKPPVSNKNLYHEAGDFIVMVVAGPNARKDYHYNETEEWFFQLEGNINVRIQEDGKARDIYLGPGDMFLCPANTPHSPARSEGSIGRREDGERARARQRFGKTGGLHGGDEGREVRVAGGNIDNGRRGRGHFFHDRLGGGFFDNSRLSRHGFSR